MAINLPTPRSLELGAVLRKAREARGLSTRGFGQLIDRNASHVVRYEGGKLIPTEDELGVMCAQLSIVGDALDALLQLREEAADPNWISGVDRQLAVLREYERTAKRIVNAQLARIPGPLQTRGYAESVMRARGIDEDGIKTRADFRMTRRDDLLASEAEFEAYISEYALRYPECDDECMVEQLLFLAEVAEKPHVTIRFVPLVARQTPLRDGSFVYIEGKEPGSDVVHLEQHTISSTLSTRQYLAGYRDAADQLRRDAMSAEDSLGLIGELIDEMEIKK